MAEVQFYHLLSTPLERALPKLMEKALAAGMRAVVRVESDDAVKRIDDALWSADSASFIPHGTMQDENPQVQSIYITTQDENPNGAKVLVVADGGYQERLDGYDKLLDMFDGHSPNAVQIARERWKKYKDQGVSVGYIQQQKDGGWKKVA